MKELRMSEEWGELSPERIGRATASRISDVIARTKSGYSTSRGNYAAELVAERYANKPYSELTANQFQSPAMKWGKDTEVLARLAYELDSNTTIENAGFVVHPTIPMAGASPDGLVSKHGGGLVEIKCPNTATHIATLKGEPIADKYIVQMQWQMACTGRTWCDWVSFDPRLPQEKRLFTKLVERDNKRIAQLEEEVQAFLAEVEVTIIYLDHRYPKEAA